jgi:putative toxin-antitoxin system antitoxin component (TIGR02293 family)
MAKQIEQVTETVIEGINVPGAVFTDPVVYIRMVRAGIPGAIVKQAIDELGGNRALFIKLLNTTAANLSRYYRKKVLDRTDSEEVLDTLRVYLQALNVFGDKQMARDWLAMPIPALAGERPLDLFDTFEGRHLVRATLRKLEHGEFS